MRSWDYGPGDLSDRCGCPPHLGNSRRVIHSYSAPSMSFRKHFKNEPLRHLADRNERKRHREGEPTSTSEPAENEIKELRANSPSLSQASSPARRESDSKDNTWTTLASLHQGYIYLWENASKMKSPCQKQTPLDRHHVFEYQVLNLQAYPPRDSRYPT